MVIGHSNRQPWGLWMVITAYCCLWAEGMGRITGNTVSGLAEATESAPTAAVQQWEYKMTEEFIRGLPEDRRVDLNAEGAQGWELSAVVRHSEYRKDFYLRRPIST